MLVPLKFTEIDKNIRKPAAPVDKPAQSKAVGQMNPDSHAAIILISSTHKTKKPTSLVPCEMPPRSRLPNS
jgi:hypothetical protein